MWWAPIACDDLREGTLVATIYEDLYGAYEGQPVNIRFYSEKTHDVVEVDLTEEQVLQANEGLPLAEILPQVAGHFAGNFGWFTWYSEYGGFQVFTKLSRRGGNCTMEHGF